ncbi:tRNA uridine-5-carboxymethylaminomethyl(34) synthesis enzyme MnmG [Gemelliphila palaticanis]|uniref:tRNA uridine 5-carboxymethylaminomethyl modification enzyme MnmG n=1 Tax=Gemelliphila palaticanis TaxID=81950 RepID=A0ABX2SX92_9BACL|nr:tRNA uridine-5-carboxymethylaminomethyl(34) synthesis enzyme MnmG [Gemella palaticanis]MBF0714906.1 tRNA uridine-5-carboxymethylaminomethyl(34) synthesis enzyme MnmG [Gemella palaticanis]NYS46836.1 tRNA uridine-5-carboxymethylaminomethyl(34) synthesis enzyme MnmG [Gemella palaticanis]
MTEFFKEYDVIVIGGGHAGIEAALASSRKGVKTLMITINLDTIGFMPCNPSVGGPAKGIVVREIDALGGAMAKIADKTNIQSRMLNTAKGPAVRALRVQSDKVKYQLEMKHLLENAENLDLEQAMVRELIVEDGKVIGLKTMLGTSYKAKVVVITTGTYLRGEIVIGDIKYSSGPNHQMPSIDLAKQLESLGFDLVRFKTGTPPRVNADTVDFSKTEIQPGDDKKASFSYETKEFVENQIPCWLTYTNATTHDIIDRNLGRSAMYSGVIKGTGPRYCPSIEDKYVRFSDKERHQLFLEPEGRETKEIYVQGLSTSLPDDVQREMVNSIAGLENAKIMRNGYAIEYDAINPTTLWPTLETKLVSGLFTAGQLNGTSGYEEAAGQGIIAGINAACKVLGEQPLILGRDEAYIGVLIDDLVTKGTNEPYRLLTSRAEHRLLLRHDNADMRLSDKAYKYGLITEERYKNFCEKRDIIKDEIERLKTFRITPTKEVIEKMKQLNTAELRDGILAIDLLRRPELQYSDIMNLANKEVKLSDDIIEQIEIEVKYEGYIKKSIQQVEKLRKMEEKRIPKNINYDEVPSLALEAREKLKKVDPMTIGQASRISGVNPADISILLVYLEQLKNKEY